MEHHLELPEHRLCMPMGGGSSKHSGPDWEHVYRTLEDMGCMLIAPELVIVWAGRQWFAARHIARMHRSNAYFSVNLLTKITNIIYQMKDGPPRMVFLPQWRLYALQRW